MLNRLFGLGKTIPWVAIIVTLGLVLRSFHYLRNPSMWHDEAALVVNVLGKSFSELLGPLFFSEAGPPLFLWLERGVTITLGDSTYALRLIPFLASSLALILLVPVAKNLLAPAALPWAVLLLAFSNRVLWHTCEAKPYAGDVLAAVIIPAVYLAFRGQPLCRPLLVFTVLAPLLIFFSFPGCFLCGGLLVAFLPRVWRERSALNLTGFGLLTFAVAGSFLLLVMGPLRAQRCGPMESCWVDQFPHWDRPWTVPAWTFFSSLDVVRYCFEPSGHVLALIALIGIINLWRLGHGEMVVLLGLPGLLALGASLFRAYPWGGARVEVFIAPAAAIFIAAGIFWLWNWLNQRFKWSVIGIAALLLAPVLLTAYRAVVYWPRADCAGAAAYVVSHRQPTDAVTANHWEYQYYFREVSSAYTSLESSRLETEFRGGRSQTEFENECGNEVERLWMIITDTDPKHPRPPDHRLNLNKWYIQDQHEFDYTSVYLLTRKKSKDVLYPVETSLFSDPVP